MMMMHCYFVPFQRQKKKKNGPGWERVTGFHWWLVCFIIHLLISNCYWKASAKTGGNRPSRYRSNCGISLTSPHSRCPLAASISPRVQRMRETTQAERRILGSSTEQMRFDPNRRRSTVSRRRARWFARPLGFYSASASVASRRQIVTLTTCDYPQD